MRRGRLWRDVQLEDAGPGVGPLARQGAGQPGDGSRDGIPVRAEARVPGRLDVHGGGNHGQQPAHRPLRVAVFGQPAGDAEAYPGVGFGSQRRGPGGQPEDHASGRRGRELLQRLLQRRVAFVRRGVAQRLERQVHEGGVSQAVSQRLGRLPGASHHQQRAGEGRVCIADRGTGRGRAARRGAVADPMDPKALPQLEGQRDPGQRGPGLRGPGLRGPGLRGPGLR